MTDSNVKFGQGGRLYADATTTDSDGFPWSHDGGESDADPLPNRVVPKVVPEAKNPAGSPPASSARPGSFRGTTSTILELAGMLSISAGFFMFSPALGLIVAGLLMVLLGFAADGGGR